MLTNYIMSQKKGYPELFTQMCNSNGQIFFIFLAFLLIKHGGGRLESKMRHGGYKPLIYRRHCYEHASIAVYAVMQKSRKYFKGQNIRNVQLP